MTTPNQATDIVTKDYMRSPETVKRFTDALGSELLANQYIQSVLILVAGDEKLAACTPMSIQKSALRAASLGLSCDPATKQAWIIPYNKKVKTAQGEKWVKEAQFQPHYLGLYQLAMRTGKYWVINVSPVYDGQRVMENPLTGLHTVVESNGFMGEPKAYNPAYVDVTTRRTKDLKVIGWIAYFKAKKGNEKSVYMSLAEIEDHAQKYVKEYEKNQNWHDADKRKTMEMKTVLRKLLAWADLSGSENAKLAEALQAETEAEPANGTYNEFDNDPEREKVIDLHPMNIDEARQVLAVINKDGKQKQLGNCDTTELNYVYLNSIHQANVEAAKIILREDFRMDPPKVEKLSTAEKIGQIGFS